ncbi:hypothetical protein JCM11491_004290 [Sporobolomyces phaffii]
MPSTVKRRRTRSPSSEVEQCDAGKEFDISFEVLSLIVSYTCQGPNASSLDDLALVSQAFASIATSLREQSLDLHSFVQVARVAKYKKTKRGKEHQATQRLVIALDTIYPAMMSSALTSLRSLFASVAPTLTSLSLSVPPSAHDPLPHLFAPSLAPLTHLSLLARFELKGGEIWFDALLTLLASWPRLVVLVLSNVRGNCTSRIAHLKGDDWSGPHLRKLVVARSTLTGRMIETLLRGQDELVTLEMPLPGGRGRDEIEGSAAWAAVERVVAPVGGPTASATHAAPPGKLRVLKIWDRWGEQTAAKKRKAERKKVKGKGKAAEAKSKQIGGAMGVNGKGKAKAQEPDSDQEEEEEEDQLASDAEHEDDEEAQVVPPPLLALVSKPSSSSIRSLLLTTAYLPSSPSPDSWLELLPHLRRITHLTIEDNPSSGLRGMVEKAMRKGKLPSLKELTSVGVKRRAAPKRIAKTPVTEQEGKAESDSEEDELVDDDSNLKAGPAAREASIEQPAMTKAETKFNDFCKSKRVEWRIEEAVWKV